MLLLIPVLLKAMKLILASDTEGDLTLLEKLREVKKKAGDFSASRNQFTLSRTRFTEYNTLKL
jgi:hypothetical protein